MRVVVDGVEFEGFSRVEVTASLRQLARTFSFTAETDGVGDIPFRKGQSVRVDVAGDPVFSGFVERLSLTFNNDGREYTVSGRDRMADVVDSNLDEMGDTGLTVRNVAETVLRFLGVDARVVDLAETDDRPFESFFDVVAPEPTDTAFQFLADVASRRQVLLTSDGLGNLVITQGIGMRVPSRIVHRVDGRGNNVEEVEFASDDSKRFGFYVTASQFNLAASSSGGVGASPREIANSATGFRDPAIRASRRRSVASESSYGQDDALARARWEANLSRVEGITYRVTLPGFADDQGNRWELNTAPEVEDEFSGIAARMLVWAVSYTLDERGETTRLDLTEPGAFQTELATLDGVDLG